MTLPTGPAPFAALGPGIVILKRTDIDNATPINVGYGQEFSIDFSASNKELFGQNKFPLVVGQTTVKATGKIKAAMINGLAWNTAFYGADLVAGNGISWARSEAHSVPGVSTYTVTVTHAADFVSDLGVVYASNGVPLQRVAAASEAQGKYSVDTATGIYTFHSSDASVAMLFAYTYDNTTGSTLAVVNTPIGQTPTFEVQYWNSLSQPTPQPIAIRIYAAVGTKHGLSFKLEDFMTPELEFGLFALPNGKVIDYYLPNTPAA